SAIGDLIYKYLYGWVVTWSDNWSIVGAFSVTVIMFTLFLKLLVFPLDIWQKEVMRRNAKKMEKMRPALEKIQKQCGSNRELLMQKQRALYKENKYSMFGSCLPMIVTLVVFFIVFGGYNAAVSKHTEETFNALDRVYTAVYEADENAALSEDEKTAKAEEAVLKAYEEEYKESFFWIKSIFAADTWADTIPNAATAAKNIPDLNTKRYEVVMRPLIEKYNEGWNGYLILPILVLLLNIASMFLNKQQMQQPAVPGQTEEQAKAQKSQAKIMQFIMPVMMFGFALFYSAAFTLYMMVNMLFTTVINLVYNVVTKKKDEAEKDRILSTTFKK
ncbi:MAG: YidC/Oxa1 family membrane protein insertase, partial [Christensenellales bacterium]